MTHRIQELLDNYLVVDAFYEAAKDVLTNPESQKYFLRILRPKNNVAHFQDKLEEIEKMAEEGNPYMQFALARIHDCLHLNRHSTKIYKENYIKAMNAGIAEARASLAYSYRDGDFGEVDEAQYHIMLQQAYEEGSEKAYQQILRDRIFGNSGIEPDPSGVSNIIEKYINEEEAGGNTVDPLYYHLLADAEIQLGRKDNAISYFEKAAEKGDSSAYFWQAIYKCCDDDLNVTDTEEFQKIMQKGRNVNASESYLTYPMLMNEDMFQTLSQENKDYVTEIFKEDLEVASLLGDNTAPWYLGYCYETGSFGFVQDYENAIRYYLRGTMLRNPMCSSAIARMVLDDHTAPEDIGADVGYECAYKSLLLGDEDALDAVIRGYRKGYLKNHSEAIEYVYLNRYQQKNEENSVEGACCDDTDITDGYDDSHEYLFDGEPEQEIQEDQWSASDTEALWKTCTSSASAAENCMGTWRDEWQIAGFVREYLDAAEALLRYPLHIDGLYAINERLLDLLYDHPRLKLRLLLCQRNTMFEIEAREGREIGITEDIEKEVSELRRIIGLADQGLFNQIPRTGHLERDPVEWTAHWEEVIDEADKLAYRSVEDAPRGMGFCFSFWPARRAELAKFGINWKDPHIMNPGVMFD